MPQEDAEYELPSEAGAEDTQLQIVPHTAAATWSTTR